MLRMRRLRSWSKWAAGVTFGLAIGAAMTAGVFVGQRSPSAAAPPWGDLQLQAMASHGSDTFAIATGAIDDDIEGLFTLDFVTGDLQCFVINPRTLSVGGRFKANVNVPLPAGKGKKPSYLMATGMINTPGSGGNTRVAGSVCYVVDANTGDVAAFSFPWSRSMTAAGGAQWSDMKLLGKWSAREVSLRQ